MIMAGCISSSFDPNILINYYPVLWATIGFLVLYIIVKYLAGKAFNKPEWEASLNIEITQVWYSLLILIAAFAFLQAGTIFACSQAGTDKSLTLQASEFLQKVMIKGSLQSMNELFTIQIFYSIYNTLNFRPHESVWTWTYKVVPGADGVVGVVTVISYGLIAVFGSLAAQIAILSLIDATMYQLLLPAGLLLRFFPPTRDAGVFLITLAIGFQIVFPAMYVINEKILNETWGIVYGQNQYTPYISTAVGQSLKYGLLLGPGAIGVAGGAANTVATKVAGLFNIDKSAPFKLVTGTVGAVTMELSAYSVTFALLRPILESLGELSVVSLFLPSLATMVTFSFIRGVTKFLLAKS